MPALFKRLERISIFLLRMLCILVAIRSIARITAEWDSWHGDGAMTTGARRGMRWRDGSSLSRERRRCGYDAATMRELLQRSWLLVQRLPVSGWIDIPTDYEPSRANGEYLVFVEEDSKAKIIVSVPPQHKIL